MMRPTHIRNEMTTESDETAMLLHCAISGGAIEPTCCNVRAITPCLAQQVARVGTICIAGVCLVALLDHMNICNVWMRIANALYECGECWQRIFHAHLYRKKEVLFSRGTRGGIPPYLGTWPRG